MYTFIWPSIKFLTALTFPTMSIRSVWLKEKQSSAFKEEIPHLPEKSAFKQNCTFDEDYYICLQDSFHFFYDDF